MWDHSGTTSSPGDRTMLDVHPPHTPTHTWKDFFIHMATICLGLLIAIGLEQTIEYFHRQHQAHQLEEDLRAESLRNLNIALVNIDAFAALRTRYDTQYTELQNAASEHRPPRQLLDIKPWNVTKAASAAWVVAQQTGTLGLLPRAEAQRYVRVSSLADQASACIVDMNLVYRKVRIATRPATTSTTAPGQTAPTPHVDLSRLTPDELRQYRESLAEAANEAGYCINRNRWFYGIEWASWHGFVSDEENLRIESDAANLDGGKDAMLAKYPLPEEAKHQPNPDAAP
jgi:hypothetical protein